MNTQSNNGWQQSNQKEKRYERTKGPEVGAAELNSLADIFEDHEITGWDEEIFEATQESVDIEFFSEPDLEEVNEDFSDLLFDEEESTSNTSEEGNQQNNLVDDRDREILDEISKLTSISSLSNENTEESEALRSQSDDDPFEDLFDLDDPVTEGRSVTGSSSSQMNNLNRLFDEASEEELDLNWSSDNEIIDSSSAKEDHNPIWDLEENDSSGETDEGQMVQQNQQSSKLEDELDLSLFADMSESENDELALEEGSDFEQIVSTDESDDYDEAVGYDDLFSMDDENLSELSLENQKTQTTDDTATEALEDLFGESQDDNDFAELDERQNLESAEEFTDLFADSLTEEINSLDETETDSTEDLGDWLNFDAIETQEEPEQDVDISGLDELFSDNNDDRIDSSNDEMLLFDNMNNSTSEAWFDDDFGLDALNNVEGPNIFENEPVNPTNFDELLNWDLGDASEVENSDGSDDLFASEAADISDEVVDGSSEVESTSDLESQPDGFTELENLLDREVDRSVSSTVDFAELAQLLGEPSDRLSVNFGELESFLEQTPQYNLQPLWFTELQEFLGEKKSPQSKSSAETKDLSVNSRERDKSVPETLTVKPRSAAHSSSRSGMSYETMRVPVKQLDNLGNLIGELVVNRNTLEQDQERMRQFLDNLLHQVQNLTDVGQRMQDLYERVLLELALLSSRRQNHHFAPEGATPMGYSTGSTGHDLNVFEMDKFTPFHTLAQEILELIVRVRESASDIEFLVDETDQVTRQLRQITNKLQEGINRSRMVPFAQTADRLPRGVRDNSIKFGKQVELVVEGSETLIDKMILENLNDPMTHLVNNALAHGIEVPEDRERKGKPPTGRITIRAFHQGNQTVISVSDDGAGIDAERVKAKALDKGLITIEEARTLSRLEVYDLLFAPGFSTKDKADDLAGRGVGLDVVRTNLSAIRGVVNIDSNLGKGTNFTIRVPLAFSISKALICISDRARIAFPMDGVEDMLDVPRDKIQTTPDDDTFIPWRDTILPFRPMRDLLVYHRNLGRGSVFGGNADEDIISVVVLRSAGNYLALQVDQVLGEQEIVIKQLEGPVPKPIGIAGATVMGDGRIVAIADVLELIDLAAGRISERSNAIWEEASHRLSEEALVQEQTTVLIVDDSITVRELLSMTFNKAGYRVEQARDGQEAWEKLKSGLPCHIVFCDIEMPRMDGLELLSRLQKDHQLSQIPMAMLTSRGAKKHMQMAIDMGARGYFTKPYLEEALLEAASRMLKGEVLVPSKSEM